MFYVKETMGDAVEVNIEINDENVFCRCPHVGLRYKWICRKS